MSKLCIYQLLPRYFGNTCPAPVPDGSIEENGSGKFNDITTKALASIKSLGITHIWYSGILEHATQTDYSSYGISKDAPEVVKGKAGSPYAVKDYYDVDPDLATDPRLRLEEFKKLIRRTHRAGMAVVIDFVPNHLARKYHSDIYPEKDFGIQDNSSLSFSPGNNFYYLPSEAFVPPTMTSGEEQVYKEFPAKVTGNDCFRSHPSVNDWYETVKLNYGVDYLSGGRKHFSPTPDTWHKMLDILLYWVEMGVDAFRCDMAEMVPVEFWQWAIGKVKKKHKKILFIGEIYNPGRYEEYIHTGLFDYLYDKVGLYDQLKAISQGYAPACSITDCWQRLGPVQDNMLNFLENHDEQRLASDFVLGDARKALPAFVVSACMRKNPFMLYCGQELGEKGMYAEGFSRIDGRSTIFDYWSLDTLKIWNHQGKFDTELLSAEQKELRRFYAKVLNLCQSQTAIREGLFFDLMYVNGNNPYFNTAKQFAFLRKSEDELLLFVVNFCPNDVHIEVVIPEHAFEYLALTPQQEWPGEDLLSGEKQMFHLSATSPASMSVSAYSARIWKYAL